VERYISQSTVQWSLTRRVLVKILCCIRLNDRPLYTQERPSGARCLGGLLGPRAGLVDVEKINVPGRTGDRTAIPVLSAP
jgi:hypothetical protein